MRTLQALMIAGALAFPATALAQTDYTANEIVKHFVPEEETTRGVTIGATGFGNDDDSATAATPAPAAVLSEDAFNLSVTFGLNSDRLTGRAERNLREFAKALKRPELSELNFAIEGHTDDSGSDAYNQELSERRANAVVRFLAGEGVESGRLKPRGYGESRPKVSQGSHPDNRRVETRLLLQ